MAEGGYDFDDFTEKTADVDDPYDEYEETAFDADMAAYDNSRINEED